MARTVKLKKRKDPLEIIAFIILTLFGLIIAVPFYNVLIVSITGQAEYLRAGGLLLFPKEPTLDSFSRLFQFCQFSVRNIRLCIQTEHFISVKTIKLSRIFPIKAMA